MEGISALNIKTYDCYTYKNIYNIKVFYEIKQLRQIILKN